MRSHLSHSSFGKSRFTVLLPLIVSILFYSCTEEPQLWQVDSREQVMRNYIASNPDQYSEFNELVRVTGMEALLNTRGPFTLFLPTDEAMLEYYRLKNAGSLEDFSDSTLRTLLLYHIVGAEISTNDIGLGTLRETNAIGDYLVTEFEGADIIVHKHSRIIDRDIRVANGYIHVIDGVIDPVKENIYSVISSDPSYGIFSEGLSIAGLKDTLQIITFPYGQKEARTRFTVLAVADTIYHRYGIHNVGDLVRWCAAHPDSLTYLNNPFYRYMEYHCLTGSYYLSDLENGILPVLSRDNNVTFRIDNEDYKINPDKNTGQYTVFIIPASNTPAKNGAVHAVNDILPAAEPEPATVIFETTDFFDFKLGDYYGKHYMRWFDGENSFEKIKWTGDYLLYFYKELSTQNMNYDCLSMRGWWTISVTFPKVMKGKYKVYIFKPNYLGMSNCVVYIDGVLTETIYRGHGPVNDLQKIADVDFKTTAEHTITLRNIEIGAMWWDYVKFVPLE